MKKQLFFTAFFLISIAQAQNIFRDDFNSYTAGQQLSGQGSWTNNSSNPGGLGSAVTGGGGANANITASSISYTGYGTSANSFEIKPNADGCGTAFTPLTTGDIYVSFVINLSASQANNNSDFFRVLSGGNFNTTFRLYAINAGFSFYISAAKGANGNPLVQSALSYSYNEDHLVVIKYSQFPGPGDDVLSLYIDPVYLNGEPATPSATTNTGADQSGSIDRMAFRQNWTNGMPTGKAGLVSVSTTWAGLGFLPLSTTVFNSSEMFADSSRAKSGVLTINCKTAIENASLQIYTLSGTLTDTRLLSLADSQNTIAIVPIQADGIYIVEITDKSTQKKYSQKIMVK